jgi:hypothetical protein
VRSWETLSSHARQLVSYLSPERSSGDDLDT